MTPTREQIDADRARQDAWLCSMREMLCDLIAVSSGDEHEQRGSDQ